ncbi:MAG: caspase family protein [Microscillaceae bacterium]|nr:caspase family protein [Microscillaceae bacterium]
MTTLIDPRTTRVLLIGTGEYEDQVYFENIPQVKNNLLELQRLFSQDAILGVYDHNIIRLYNQKDGKIYDALANLCEDPSVKTLIIYYVGHSCVNGGFYFTAKNSRQNRIEQNGILFEHLKNRLKHAKAENILLILDTCQSGRASDQSDREFWLSILPSKNIWMLTSSPRHRASFFNKQNLHTHFTGALIKVLKEGIPGSFQKLDLKQIHKAIQEEMANAGNTSKPGLWSSNRNKFDGFKNRAYHANAEFAQEEESTLGGSKPLKKPQSSGFAFLLSLILFFGFLYFLLNSEPSAKHSQPGVIGTWKDARREIEIKPDNTYMYQENGVVKTGYYTLEEADSNLVVRLICEKTNWNYLLDHIEIQGNHLRYQDWSKNQIELSAE